MKSGNQYRCEEAHQSEERRTQCSVLLITKRKVLHHDNPPQKNIMPNPRLKPQQTAPSPLMQIKSGPSSLHHTIDPLNSQINTIIESTSQNSRLIRFLSRRLSRRPSRSSRCLLHSLRSPLWLSRLSFFLRSHTPFARLLRCISFRFWSYFGLRSCSWFWCCFRS